ncbi:hypothetical protein HPB50_007807 [Hyalomma asiaticum]|uniref:Uncharacterized protein n=1 Tax=Hyalomma asiaticum TaxID=266040 RepID=A0ACB7STC9_HYAAI|nr:hypothetical protein HPB50_007807 [Hyalomma asiaticum]
MNLPLVVVSLLVAASAWTATSWGCPVIGSVLSLICHVWDLLYSMLGTQTLKLTEAYQFMSLFVRVNASGATVQPSGTSRILAGMVPYQLSGMLQRILHDYTADAAAFGRRAESTKRGDGPVMLISRAGWPVMPRDGRLSEFEHAYTDNDFSWVDRSASTFPNARPARGFFRRPRVEELGRPPTAEEIAEHELEMIQRIDSNGCLQKLCCEIGADPELYWRYHPRVAMFLRGLHRLVGGWKADELPALLARYGDRDIFNADQRGLFYKAEPNKTYATSGSHCHGDKRSKECLTVLFCCNTDGTERTKLLLIGKSEHPRALRHVKNMPVERTANTKAWMTKEIFNNWLLRFDKQLVKQHRKVLLFLDNCSSHMKPPQLEAIELAYFPPNATSILQPIDQGIVRSVKAAYRTCLVERLLFDMQGNRESKVRFPVEVLASVWQQLKTEVVKNCFRKAGFKRDINEAASEESSIPVEP